MEPSTLEGELAGKLAHASPLCWHAAIATGASAAAPAQAAWPTGWAAGETRVAAATAALQRGRHVGKVDPGEGLRPVPNGDHRRQLHEGGALLVRLQGLPRQQSDHVGRSVVPLRFQFRNADERHLCIRDAHCEDLRARLALKVLVHVDAPFGVQDAGWAQKVSVRPLREGGQVDVVCYVAIAELHGAWLEAGFRWCGARALDDFDVHLP
mmetsp:Transcript_107512/g.302607  ORF Transcript_107512/g.302607 Transcript_107512/m.302607 type:complete len:210 (+) Transcript_107512:176-805(+)